MDKTKIWDWKKLKLEFADLLSQDLTTKNIEAWMAGWTETSSKADETYNRVYVATSVNTADKEAEAVFTDFIENIYPDWQAQEQKMKEKLLASGLSPTGFEIPLRNMRAEADLFSEDNLPLKVQEEKISNQHDKIMGAQDG